MRGSAAPSTGIPAWPGTHVGVWPDIHYRPIACLDGCGHILDIACSVEVLIHANNRIPGCLTNRALRDPAAAPEQLVARPGVDPGASRGSGVYHEGTGFRETRNGFVFKNGRVCVIIAIKTVDLFILMQSD